MDTSNERREADITSTLTVQRLRCLREVAERGSIAAAAERLWLTPSAVSQQLAALQRETNVELLERSGRGVRLTPAGRLLADHAERVFHTLESAAAALRAFQTVPIGRIRVAVLPSFVGIVLETMEALQREYVELSFEIEDLEADQSLAALKDGRVDVALIGESDWVASARSPGMKAVQLFEDPLVVAYASEHPLGDQERIDWADLADEPWIIGQPPWSFLAPVFEQCRSAGFEPRVIARVRERSAALGLIRQRWGVAVLPRMGVLGDAEGVAWRVVEGPVLNRGALAVTSGASTEVQAVQALIAALRSRPAPTASCSSETRIGEP